MAERGTAKGFAKSYEAYTSVIEALGYEVDDTKVLERVADVPATRARLQEFLQAYRSGALNGELVDRGVWQRTERLRRDLAAQIEPEAVRLGDARAQRPAELGTLVAGLPESYRDWLADIVAHTEHRELVKARKMPVEEFQKLLRDFAGEQTLARQKLIAHMKNELLKRGIEMSCQAIEERFRSHPAVRTMPYCVRQILKGLGPEFRTGLVPMRRLTRGRDADEWLRRVQRELMFRSQSAMHKAIAEATGLGYDCIHKALSGRKKAKRIHVCVKRCLDSWTRKARRGEDIDVREGYRGVPVSQLQGLVPRLLELFRTKEAAWRSISARTGVRVGSIRRYFRNDGQIRFAPLSVHRVAKGLAEGEMQAERGRPSMPVRRHQAEGAVAGKAQEALSRWRRDKQNENLERSFKDLRRELIVRLKRRRAERLVAV